MISLTATHLLSLWACGLKKKPHPKSWEFLVSGLIENWNLECSLSCLWGTVLKRQGRTQDIRVLQQKPGNHNIKNLLWIKENQTSRYEFSAFLGMGRCRSLGSLRSFLPYMHLNHLGSVFCSSPSWIPSGCTARAAAVAVGLMAATSFVYWSGR